MAKGKAGKQPLPQRDMEFSELENQSLLNSEPRAIEDEKRNAMFGAGLAAVAAICCLVAMILVWILYYRERTRTFLWDGISLIFIMLFGFICAAYCAMAMSAVKTGKPVSPPFTLFVFLFSCIAGVFLIAEAFWLIFYRRIHFAYLIGLRTEDDLWDHRMTSGSSFEDGWKSSRRMMWWVTLFILIAGICFLFVAYVARSVTWNRFELTRIALYAASFFAILAGFIVIYWCEEIFEYLDFSDIISKQLTTVLKYLAIAAIVVSFINAVVNFIKSKMGYFLMGIITIILVILLVCAVGLVWRGVRRNQHAQLDSNCQDTLYPLHENNLENVCIVGGKYLNPGESCSKEFTVVRWESDEKETRSLNPGCCEIARQHITKPFMYLGLWGMILTMCLAIALGCNFYLADTTEYLSNSGRKVTPADILGLAAIIILIACWILYFIFRKKNKLEGKPHIWKNSYNDPKAEAHPDYPFVPTKIVEDNEVKPTSAAASGAVPFQKTNAINPIFNAQASCGGNCVERVAVLALDDATISFDGNYGGAYANLGESKSSVNFFPECHLKDGNYFFVYGSNDQIKKTLDTLKVKGKARGATPDVLFYHDQVSSTDINNVGLKSGETTSNDGNVNDASKCGNGFTTSTVCKDTCKIRKTMAADFTKESVKGQLFYVENGVEKTDVPATVGITTEGVDGAVVTQFENGYFIVENVPRYENQDYFINLNIHDSDDTFLDKKLAVIVPKSDNAEQVSAGKIKLLTQEGSICRKGEACRTDRQHKKGKVLVNVHKVDGSGNALGLKGASVSLYDQQNGKESLVATEGTNEAGLAEFNDVPYGAYTAVANSNGLNSRAALVEHQDDISTTPPLLLSNINGNDSMLISAEMNDPSVDFDLNLLVQNKDGKSCTVSPQNKYCGYAVHDNDVSNGVGTENIKLNKLAAANYLSYVAPSPAYSSNCQAGTIVDEANAKYEGSWNWDTVKNSKILEYLPIKIRTLGKSLLSLSGIKTAFYPGSPVEFGSSDRTAKKVISRGGNILSTAQQYMIDTDQSARKTWENPDQSAPATNQRTSTTTTTTTTGNSTSTNNPESAPQPETAEKNTTTTSTTTTTTTTNNTTTNPEPAPQPETLQKNTTTTNTTTTTTTTNNTQNATSNDTSSAESVEKNTTTAPAATTTTTNGTEEMVEAPAQNNTTETNSTTTTNNTTTTTTNTTTANTTTDNNTTTGNNTTGDVIVINKTIVINDDHNHTTTNTTTTNSDGTQTTNSTTTVTPKRVLASSNSNYIVGSCFTGFGEVSKINMNKYTVDRPTLDECLNLLKSKKPAYTLEKLLEKIEDLKK